jgi:outer membrane receptor for ferrienterochelin and colicin
MPGALYPTDIDDIGRRGTTHPDDKGFTSDGFVVIEPKTTFFVAGNKINASFAGTFRNRRTKGLSVYTAGLSEYETVHHIATYELRPKLETSVLWKQIDNKLLIGADYFYAKDNILSGNRVGSQQDETSINKETIGLYIHDNIKISDIFLINTGGRIEWADYVFNQKKIIVNHESKKIKEAAFNFGAGYKYNNKSQIYFDISRSYRFPNTEEFYQNKFLNTWVWPPEIQGGLNVDLEHQQAINYEIGVRDVSFDWLQLSISGFLMDIKNEIYFDPDPSVYTNANYKPKTRHYGIESEARVSLADGKLNPFINWTLQESFFKGGIYAGNQVPSVPKNKISAGITITPLEGLNWTTGLNYVSSRYKISDQNNLAPKLKSYTTVDTRLSYDYKFMNVWGGIKNIFGKKYYAYGVTNSTGTAETFYPAPERRFEAGMTLTF